MLDKEWHNMRHYQWDDSSYEARQFPGKELTFIGDAKEQSGCIVQCGWCDYEFNEEGLEVCPNCKNHLVFPRCDW